MNLAPNEQVPVLQMNFGSHVFGKDLRRMQQQTPPSEYQYNTRILYMTNTIPQHTLSELWYIQY